VYPVREDMARLNGIDRQDNVARLSTQVQPPWAVKHTDARDPLTTRR
jgi:hypothetical protein